jgi:hypothetical protein
MAVRWPYCRLAWCSIRGGYLVLKELGAQSMGRVYLARQLAFNRNVALKVMKPQWADNARFLEQFTLNAYAAAQLTHPNLVPILAFGQDKGRTYFSREFVEGPTLAELVGEKQQLEAREAACYVLQAARGLKCAHDQNMMHLDVRLENLFLDHDGTVKVADLGLSLTPDCAEAQERDGAPFNSLADVSALGRTLHVLVSCQARFEGQIGMEGTGTQQVQPADLAQATSNNVARDLAAIIVRMVANEPDQRYANMGEVIRGLESYLGISSTLAFIPRAEDADLLEQSAKAWHESPSARVRARAMTGILAGCAAMTLLCVLPGWWLAASAFFSLGLSIALADFVLTGVTRKTPLFQKVTALVLGSSRSEWLTILASAALLVGLLLLLKLLWIWVVERARRRCSAAVRVQVRRRSLGRVL